MNAPVSHPSVGALQRALTHLLGAPRDAGVVRLVVRRPGPGEREILTVGRLDPAVGLVGDSWAARPSNRTPDGSPHPDMQLTVMNARVAQAVAGSMQRWPLAGDQLYVDFDLSEDHLPAGTWLAVGQAVVEVTDQPHTGCAKFTERFGLDALRFVNSPEGRANRLRGANARVVTAGDVRPGDAVRVVRVVRPPDRPPSAE